jgi:hypothetical protein
VKQKRALRERNSPRNNRLELIDADERRERRIDAALGFTFHIGSIDSRCLENSCNTLPRSGLHVLSVQLSLELDRRQISKGRVQAFLVVDLCRNSAIEARASARSRYSLRKTSSNLSVFMNDSQAALSYGLPLRLMLISIPCASASRCNRCLHTGCRDPSDAPDVVGCFGATEPCAAPSTSTRLPCCDPEPSR